MKNFVNPDNSKARPDGGKYSEVLKNIRNDGVCPFCEDHLKNYHKKPLFRKKYWWVTDNMYPYPTTKHHKLFIHIEHISHINEISAEAWVELSEIINEETLSQDIAGGSFIMRFGDTKYTGASVSHLHAHIVQSDPDHTDYSSEKGLTMRIG